MLKISIEREMPENLSQYRQEGHYRAHYLYHGNWLEHFYKYM